MWYTNNIYTSNFIRISAPTSGCRNMQTCFMSVACHLHSTVWAEWIRCLSGLLRLRENIPMASEIFRYTSGTFPDLTECLSASFWTATDQVIRSFKQYNIRISMDDFGSGYSSLNTLKDLLFDEVKLDRKFLCKISFWNRRRGRHLLLVIRRFLIHKNREFD